MEDNKDEFMRKVTLSQSTAKMTLYNNNHVHKLKSKEKGLHIGIGHDNWNLVLHMIFGVSKSVRNSVLDDAFEIIEEDFKRKTQIISERSQSL